MGSGLCRIMSIRNGYGKADKRHQFCVRRVIADKRDFLSSNICRCKYLIKRRNLFVPALQNEFNA